MSRVIQLLYGIVITANLLTRLEPTSANLQLEGVACYAMASSIPGLKLLSGNCLPISIRYSSDVNKSLTYIPKAAIFRLIPWKNFRRLVIE